MTYVNYGRTVDDIYKSGYGGCEDMCLVGLYVMRSLGILVAKKMTLWGRMNRGHEWCSVLGKDSKWHAFGTGEDQPDELMSKWKQIKYKTLPKVYRETYASQENDKLRSLFDSNSFPASIYNSFHIKDVTADYLPSNSISLPMKEPRSFYYLCVFNLGKWVPVDFAQTENNIATFTNIGTDFENN